MRDFAKLGLAALAAACCLWQQVAAWNGNNVDPHADRILERDGLPPQKRKKVRERHVRGGGRLKKKWLDQAKAKSDAVFVEVSAKADFDQEESAHADDVTGLNKLLSELGSHKLSGAEVARISSVIGDILAQRKTSAGVALDQVTSQSVEMSVDVAGNTNFIKDAQNDGDGTKLGSLVQDDAAILSNTGEDTRDVDLTQAQGQADRGRRHFEAKAAPHSDREAGVPFNASGLLQAPWKKWGAFCGESGLFDSDCMSGECTDDRFCTCRRPEHCGASGLGSDYSDFLCEEDSCCRKIDALCGGRLEEPCCGGSICDEENGRCMDISSDNNDNQIPQESCELVDTRKPADCMTVPEDEIENANSPDANSPDRRTSLPRDYKILQGFPLFSQLAFHGGFACWASVRAAAEKYAKIVDTNGKAGLLSGTSSAKDRAKTLYEESGKKPGAFYPGQKYRSVAWAKAAVTKQIEIIRPRRDTGFQESLMERGSALDRGQSEDDWTTDERHIGKAFEYLKMELRQNRALAFAMSDYSGDCGTIQHFATIIGWADEQVLVADPWCFDGPGSSEGYKGEEESDGREDTYNHKCVYLASITGVYKYNFHTEFVSHPPLQMEGLLRSNVRRCVSYIYKVPKGR